jgi:hypothetical protein
MEWHDFHYCSPLDARKIALSNETQSAKRRSERLIDKVGMVLKAFHCL